jgi:ATP-dependent Clp protease ATP-binding subunit ClpA
MAKVNILQIAGQLDTSLSLRFARMKSELGQVVLGQNYAISKITDFLKIEFSQKNKRQSPITFLFAGPRGIGKTEVARHIPHYLFGRDLEIVFFDMKQFNTDDRVRRLLGSDGQVGILEQILRENPFNVFLFENIEHSTKSFCNGFYAFIRNFDSDISRSIFIFTTAALSYAWSDVKNISEERIILRAVKKMPQIFPKFFLEKISSIVMFKSVGEKEASILMTNWIDQKRTEVFNKTGIKIHISPSTEKKLITEGLSREFGIRKLKVIFEDLFVGTLEKYIERGTLSLSKQWQFKIIGTQPLLEPLEKQISPK